MLVPFKDIAPTSKIWIYQSDRKMSNDEKHFAQSFLENYTNAWKAHGQPLRGSFDIRFEQFIIMAADESYNSTSGCSVDDSVRAIKEIESQTGLNFFNRNRIAFLKDQRVYLLDLSGLKENYKTNIWDEATLTFNNLIVTKSELENQWIVPAGNTWLKRFVPQETAKT
jgi:hypothetical protein